MHSRVVIAALVTALVAACAAPNTQPAGPQLPEGFTSRVVLARDTAPHRGPLGVTDRFFLDGKVVAYASFTWSDVDAVWGKQKIESRWYSGDRLIKRTETEFKVGKPPFNFWSMTYPSAFGAGKAHVEIFWNGQKLVERHFEIIDQTATRDAPPPGMQPTLWRTSFD